MDKVHLYDKVPYQINVFNFNLPKTGVFQFSLLINMNQMEIQYKSCLSSLFTTPE